MRLERRYRRRQDPTLPSLPPPKPQHIVLLVVDWAGTMTPSQQEMHISPHFLKEDRDFSNSTYKQFLAALLECSEDDDLESALGEKLGVTRNADIIKRLKWLGLFRNGRIPPLNKSNVDVTVELMLKRMSYQPHEKDMIIIHNEVIADFHGGRESRVSTVLLEGIPLGDSAMSRAVSLPAAIASKLILEDRVSERGVIMPVCQDIYLPVLKELESDHGFVIRHKTIRLDDSFVGFGRGEQ
ncbi:saccharopine dehydrogenase C-terminal domain-containing protein [Gemmatimonadota bacterium]